MWPVNYVLQKAKNYDLQQYHLKLNRWSGTTKLQLLSEDKDGLKSQKVHILF